MNVGNRQRSLFLWSYNIPEGGDRQEAGNVINKKIAQREELMQRPWGRTVPREAEEQQGVQYGWSRGNGIGKESGEGRWSRAAQSSLGASGFMWLLAFTFTLIKIKSS